MDCCGGMSNGISEILLHGKSVEKFQKENCSSTDDNIRCVVAEFHVCLEE